MQKFMCAADPIAAADLNPDNPIWKWQPGPDSPVKIDRLQRGRPAEIITAECFMRAGSDVRFNYDIDRQVNLGDLVVVNVGKGLVKCVTVDAKRNAFITEKLLNRWFENEMWVVFNAGQNKYQFAVRLTDKSREVIRMMDPIKLKDFNGDTVKGYYVMFKDLRKHCNEDLIVYGDVYAPKDCEFILSAINTMKQVQQDINEHTGWVPYSEMEDRGKHKGDSENSREYYNGYFAGLWEIKESKQE
jgi:hypothetical protein